VKIRKLWNQFWFAPTEQLPVEVFRVFVGITGGFFYLFRMFDFEFFFGEQGILTADGARDMTPPSFRSPIPWEMLAALPSPLPEILHGVFVLLLFAIGLGLFSGRNARIAVIAAFIIHLSFLFRNFGIIYGPDLVLTCWLFYLCFMNHSVVLRIGRPYHRGVKSDSATGMARRLAQLHLCTIYAYSGFEKARGMSWWRGDALWAVFGNGQIVSWDLSFVAPYPILLVLATFSTLLWEVYFPVLVWTRLKHATLLFGVALHSGIGLLMNLKCFALSMLAPYALFLSENTLEKIFSPIHAAFRDFLVAMAPKRAYKKIWRK
jgi:hypothetical protein